MLNCLFTCRCVGPNTIEEEEKKTSRAKVIVAIKTLQGWLNPEATDIIDVSISGREIVADWSDIAMMVSDHQEEAVNFKEVWGFPIEDDKSIW